MKQSPLTTGQRGLLQIGKREESMIYMKTAFGSGSLFVFRPGPYPGAEVSAPVGAGNGR